MAGQTRKQENKERRNTTPPKYIFIVGGVISGIGKGVATSAIGNILQSKGYKVTALKIDPYVNVDAGTMNPTEHGEVFVLDDGYETDQDMGNYERFLNETMPEVNYMTTGRVYQSLIERERAGEFGGKNVEVVPDVPLEVLRRVKRAQELAGADVTLVEVGGTIGEYQNIIFLEAARMLKRERPHDVAIVMLSYVPIPSNIGEMKTKPTQYTSRELNAAGLQADVILARADVPLDQKRKEKIATFCNLPTSHVISAPDVASIYDVPLNYEKDGLGDILTDILGLPKRESNLADWKAFVEKTKNPRGELNIAVVGKYFMSGEYVLSDVYISVIEAVRHAGAAAEVKVNLTYLDSEAYERDASQLEELRRYDGVVVPGGFGSRGVEGVIQAVEFVRTHNIPYFGLCYGMQLMTVEYARNVAGLQGAHTVEIDQKTPYPVIAVMENQKEHVEKSNLGGTMRLGAYPCVLKDGTIARGAYQTSEINERHRHRYEVNPKYIEQLEKAGLVFSGRSPSGILMEIAELPRSQHPFMLGTQFHPEFLSRPLAPHPLFVAFVQAAKARRAGTTPAASPSAFAVK